MGRPNTEQGHPQSPARAYPEVERRVHVCPVLVAREVEDPAEAGAQEAGGHVLRQQPRCAARGGGQRCGTPPVRHPVPHSGPLAGSGATREWRPSPRWPSYLMSAMASMAFCRTSVSRRSLGSSCSSACRAQRDGWPRAASPGQRAATGAGLQPTGWLPRPRRLPGLPAGPCSGKGRAQHPARGCSPRGRASPHLDALRHLQLAEIHRVPRAVVHDGGLAGVADGGQKPQLLRLSLSRGGERRASGSGEPSRGCPQEPSSRGTKASERASGTLGLRLQQARRKLRASSSSSCATAEAEGPTPEPEGACSGCTSVSS